MISSEIFWTKQKRNLKLRRINHLKFQCFFKCEQWDHFECFKGGPSKCNLTLHLIWENLDRMRTVVQHIFVQGRLQNWNCYSKPWWTWLPFNPIHKAGPFSTKIISCRCTIWRHLNRLEHGWFKKTFFK